MDDARPQGPTQWVDAMENGELGPAYNPTASAPQVTQLGADKSVDVAAAVAAAGAEGHVLSDEDRESIDSVVSGDAELDAVTKDKLVAAIHEINDGLGDDEEHLAVTGTKEELVERLREHADAS